MTVGEMIEQLKQYDLSTEIAIDDWYNDSYADHKKGCLPELYYFEEEGRLYIQDGEYY